MEPAKSIALDTAQATLDAACKIGGAFLVAGLIVVAVAAGAIVWALRRSASSYFTEHGKNMATKQDIAEITRLTQTARDAAAKEHAGDLAMLTEKGRNAATKEDIRELTSIVETVKREQAETLEEVKALHVLEIERAKERANRRLLVHRVQFEREFAILSDLWAAAVAMNGAAVNIRPSSDFAPPPGEAEDDRKKRRLDVYDKAAIAFRKIVLDNEPFFPPAVFEIAWKLRGACDWEGIQVAHGRGRGEGGEHWVNYYKAADQSAEKIKALSDQLCQAIRERISATDAQLASEAATTG